MARIFKKLRLTKLFHRLARDTDFRLSLTLCFSLFFHFSYAVFGLATGLYHRQSRLVAPALYFVLLLVMRCFLLRDFLAKEKERTQRHYRLYGIGLLAMMPLLLAIVILIVTAKKPLVWRGITTLITALYTLIAFTLAVKVAVP